MSLNSQIPRWALWLGSILCVVLLTYLSGKLFASVDAHEGRLTTIEAKIDYLVEGHHRVETKIDDIRKEIR